jgi:hypothetical protein
MKSTIRRAWFRLDRHDDDPPAPDPADPATEPDDEPDPQDEPDDDPDDNKPLGPKGQKALDAMKAQRAEAKREAAAAKKQAAELAKKVAEFEDRDKTELERATAKAEQATARAEAATKRAVVAEVRVAAADFADPDDAAAFLDLTRYADDSGDIDTEAIRADLSDLLERKPHLRKAVAVPEPPKNPRPDPGQGPRQPVPPTDYRTASREEVDAKLAELGVRLRR